MRIAVFEPHVPESRHHDPDGYWTALRSDASFDLLAGHCSAYGVHRFYDVEQPRYFVMLREPVDRAASYYYFVRQSMRSDSYSHPALEDATKYTLAEFYERPEYQNIQTRYIAGVEWEYAGRYLDLNGKMGKLALQRAKSNLTKKYEAFGLKERFEESAELMASRLGVEVSVPEKKYKSTRNRPMVSDLSDATRRSLRQANALDVALYEFARVRFLSLTRGRRRDIEIE
jgi:hypothetical protein